MAGGAQGKRKGRCVHGAFPWAPCIKLECPVIYYGSNMPVQLLGGSTSASRWVMRGVRPRRGRRAQRVRL